MLTGFIAIEVGNKLYLIILLGIIKLIFGLEEKYKLAAIVEGNPKAPLSIATTLRCREGHYSIPWNAPLYP